MLTVGALTGRQAKVQAPRERTSARYLRGPVRPARRGRRPPPWPLRPSARLLPASPAPARPADRPEPARPPPLPAPRARRSRPSNDFRRPRPASLPDRRANLRVPRTTRRGVWENTLAGAGPRSRAPAERAWPPAWRVWAGPRGPEAGLSPAVASRVGGPGSAGAGSLHRAAATPLHTIPAQPCARSGPPGPVPAAGFAAGLPRGHDNVVFDARSPDIPSASCRQVTRVESVL